MVDTRVGKPLKKRPARLENLIKVGETGNQEIVRGREVNGFLFLQAFDLFLYQFQKFVGVLLNCRLRTILFPKFLCFALHRIHLHWREKRGLSSYTGFS